jgi:two-component system OmpR family sensor kinase
MRTGAVLSNASIMSPFPLNIQSTDIATIVDAEADRAATLAPQLTVARTGQTALTVQADPTRVAQILSDLLDNARRHTPRGGRITIDLNYDKLSLAGYLVVVTVTDTGHGIPDEQRERIFERLVRWETARTRDHGGAGLGLPIARALARAHGGDLICVSHQGGAQFRLTMPRGEG